MPNPTKTDKDKRFFKTQLEATISTTSTLRSFERVYYILNFTPKNGILSKINHSRLLASMSGPQIDQF